MVWSRLLYAIVCLRAKSSNHIYFPTACVITRHQNLFSALIDVYGLIVAWWCVSPWTIPNPGSTLFPTPTFYPPVKAIKEMLLRCFSSMPIFHHQTPLSIKLFQWINDNLSGAASFPYLSSLRRDFNNTILWRPPIGKHKVGLRCLLSGPTEMFLLLLGHRLDILKISVTTPWYQICENPFPFRLLPALLMMSRSSTILCNVVLSNAFQVFHVDLFIMEPTFNRVWMYACMEKIGVLVRVKCHNSENSMIFPPRSG